MPKAAEISRWETADTGAGGDEGAESGAFPDETPRPNGAGRLEDDVID